MLLLLLPALQQFVVKKFGARQQCRGILRSRLLPHPLLLQTTNHAVHLTVTSGSQQLLGLIQHLLIEAQSAGNRKRVTSPGDAPQQLIGGRQGFDIEGYGGVFEAAVAVFERLQLTEVGGRHREPSSIR